MRTVLERLLLLTLLTGAYCTITSKPAQQLDIHSSPLDSVKGSSDVNGPSFWTHGAEYAAEPPSCQMACTAPVVDVLSAFFRAESFKTNMNKACNSYNEALGCMVLHSHCGADSMFDSVTSGLKYMCKDQIEAFKALADCIDENSARVKKDCDTHCHSTSLATGLLLKDTVMTQLDHPLVSQSVNMRKIIEPHMTRLFFSEGCRIAECVMGCTRTKYNMLCEGTAGSIMLEMLTRPLSMDGEPFPTATHLASFLGGFFPRSCGFLTTSGGRNSFRIDPELDKEIKRMYSDKNRRSGTSLSDPLSEPVQIQNPFMELPEIFHRASPIDITPASWVELLGSGNDVEEELNEETERLEESSGLEGGKSGLSDLEGSGLKEKLKSDVSVAEGSGFNAKQEPSIRSLERSGGGDEILQTAEFSGVEASGVHDSTESSGVHDSTEYEASGIEGSGFRQNWARSLKQEEESSAEEASGTSVEGSGIVSEGSGVTVEGSGVTVEGSGEEQKDLYFLIDEFDQLPSYRVKAAEQYRIHTLSDAYVEGELVCYIEPIKRIKRRRRSPSEPGLQEMI